MVWRVDWTLEFCTFSKWLRGAARRWALAQGVAQHWVSLLFSPAFSPPAVGSSSELRLLICHMGMRGPVGGMILRCESAGVPRGHCSADGAPACVALQAGGVTDEGVAGLAPARLGAVFTAAFWRGYCYQPVPRRVGGPEKLTILPHSKQRQ